MNILFLSYWNISDGLSQSTVLPHVSILAKNVRIKKILLFTVERQNNCATDLPEKVQHIPLVSKKNSGLLLNKISDFVLFPRQIEAESRKHSVSLMICRSSLAGALGYMVYKRTGIPFIVESFEPHASYMVESGVWRKWGLRNLLQIYWEKKQKKYARLLLTVSEHYKRALVSQGVPDSKIKVMPCCVDLERFGFNEYDRSAIRRKYEIPMDSLAAIYVGKFGGMYMEREALVIFREILQRIRCFYLFVITPNNADQLWKWVKEVGGFEGIVINFLCVPHQDVQKYLSASDFAFATYKPSPSKRFLSPIKVGEYWANGLPVMIPENIGDDSGIIEREGCGVVIDQNDLSLTANKLKALLAEGRVGYSAWINSCAHKYRNMKVVEDTYQSII